MPARHKGKQVVAEMPKSDKGRELAQSWRKHFREEQVTKGPKELKHKPAPKAKAVPKMNLKLPSFKMPKGPFKRIKESHAKHATKTGEELRKAIAGKPTTGLSRVTAKRGLIAKTIGSVSATLRAGVPAKATRAGAAKLGAKLTSRAIPGIGTALLATDIFTWSGKNIVSAVKEGVKAYKAHKHLEKHKKISTKKFKPGLAFPKK